MLVFWSHKPLPGFWRGCDRNGHCTHLRYKIIFIREGIVEKKLNEACCSLIFSQRWRLSRHTQCAASLRAVLGFSCSAVGRSLGVEAVRSSDFGKCPSFVSLSLSPQLYSR